MFLYIMFLFSASRYALRQGSSRPTGDSAETSSHYTRKYVYTRILSCRENKFARKSLILPAVLPHR